MTLSKCKVGGPGKVQRPPSARLRVLQHPSEALACQLDVLRKTCKDKGISGRRAAIEMNQGGTHARRFRASECIFVALHGLATLLNFRTQACLPRAGRCMGHGGCGKASRWLTGGLHGEDELGMLECRCVLEEKGDSPIQIRFTSTLFPGAPAVCPAR